MLWKINHERLSEKVDLTLPDSISKGAEFEKILSK